MEGFPLDHIIDAIDAEISRLQKVRELLSTGGSVSSGTGKKAAKRKLSAAARAKISTAQKKRWAAVKRRW
jgi:hypothetical protein